MFEELHRKMNRFWNADRTLNETDPEFIGLRESHMTRWSMSPVPR